ncbi:ATP-dependent protease La [Psychromonas ingrahamii 37]|uniref:ATP-dependent protease La n=1 Tax=Psychromonas ingrahamii (strain DSM 17664 / CCUG 51855 / 37) TaxID=357804 RepID=A1SW84_PSYIN|nr:AAA family ATPase [Psychromonas ingrahamii]ABM03749.1 ATP-dependent protease La [Psychromonas ingrahamii 37]
MPIHNSNTPPEAQPDNGYANPLKPLAAEQCSPDFSVRLSNKNNNKDNWLSMYPVVSQIIAHFEKLPQPLLVFNSIYWQAATSVIFECSPPNYPLLALLNYNQETLFGRLTQNTEKTIDFEQGEIFNYNHGCLVLDISPLLINPPLWFLIKSFLITRTLPARSAVNGEKFKEKPPEQPLDRIDTKIILVANRYQLDELSQIDPEYNQVGSLFTELSAQIDATDENINCLQNFCLQLIAKNNLIPLSADAMSLLFHHLASLCEHQKRLLFSPEAIEKMLRYAQLFSPNADLLEAAELQKVIDLQSQAQSLAQNFSDQALLEKQLKIQLKGKETGQINGLSVVELMGYPTEFGEIFRISASDMIGDGEIIDVERKVEMAGNIHAKSTLIVQGYLNHLFTHVHNFPLSCNVVFEQSYQESDGDSAALAILLAVTSCYAQTPAHQNLFVTGALDQHGNVLAIGGINQKIQSVTRLFSIGLLNDPITILIPAANYINLTLDAQSMQLVRDNKINIFGINHCREAFPFALNASFIEIVSLINKRVELLQKEVHEESEHSLLSRVFSKFR